MRVVTAWHRDVGDGLQFNHIDDRFDPASLDTPTPKCPEHRQMWRNGIWIGRRATLSDDVPPKLEID